MPSSRSARLVAPVALLALLAARAGAQQPMPFLGHGDFAPSKNGDPVDVYVSVFVDRMLKIDDREYEYEAVLWIYMSWRDPRVRQIIADTKAKLTAPNSTYKCSYPCQSSGKAIAGGCCDDVWQPYVAFTNIRWLPEDRVARYAFGWNPVGDNVWYWRAVHAIYYTSMDLRAYPFDQQALLLQMEAPQARTGWSGSLVNLIPSSTGSAMFTARTGTDQLSGWSVNDVRLLPYNYPICKLALANVDNPSAPDDPSPLVPPYLSRLHGRAAQAACAAIIGAQPNPRASVYWRNAQIAGIPGQVIQVSGLNVVIVVSRFWAPLIITAIFPVVSTTWLAFLVFFLPRRDMEARLGAVTGLFLALAAIQFVITGMTPASSYVTALQQLVLLSYVFLLLVGLENVFIWWLTTYHEELSRARQHKAAQRAYSQKLVRSAMVDWLSRARASKDTRDGNGAAAGCGDGEQAGGVGRRARDASSGGAGMGAADSLGLLGGALHKSDALMGSGGGGAGGRSKLAAAVMAAQARADVPATDEVRLSMPPGGGLVHRNGSSGSERGASEPGSGAAVAALGRDDGRLERDVKRGMQHDMQHEGDFKCPPKDAMPLPDTPSLKSLRGGSRSGSGTSGGRHAAPSEAGSESAFAHLPWWERWPAVAKHRWRVFKAMINEDEAYADRVAHRWNKRLAISQFILYNAAVVIIFGAASHLSGEYLKAAHQ